MRTHFTSWKLILGLSCFLYEAPYFLRRVLVRIVAKVGAGSQKAEEECIPDLRSDSAYKSRSSPFKKLLDNCKAYLC